MTKGILLLAALLLQGFQVFSQWGMLDSTFGDNGIASHALGGGGFLAIQDDGKILQSGSTYADAPNYSVIRFNSDGSLDNTFGASGIATANVGSGSDYGWGISLQPDGKILVAGNCDSGGKACFGLVRFNSDGSIDNSFSGDGMIITSFNNNGYGDYGFAVTVQEDGRIIEVGSAQDNSAMDGFGVVRFNQDGSLDNTFGTGGKVMTPIGNPHPTANCVTMQADGKILVGGYSTATGSAPRSFALVRYNVDGSLDNSFGNGGKDTTYFGGGGSTGDSYDTDMAMGIIIQPDGKILMTGKSHLGYLSNIAIPIVRYNTDGSLDQGFGENGKVLTVHDTISYHANAITLQVDGKILIAGYTIYEFNFSRRDFLLVRYLSNGIPDSTFGINGFVITSIDDLTDEASSVIIQPDGKILVGGYSGLGWTVIRYLSGLEVGILDLTIEKNPVLIYPNPIYSSATLQYTLPSQENITINLFDLQGSNVQTLITSQLRMEGSHNETLYFDSSLPPGFYLLSISNGVNSQSIKIELVK